MKRILLILMMLWTLPVNAKEVRLNAYDVLNPDNPLRTDEEYVGEYEEFIGKYEENKVSEGIAFSIKLEDGEFRLKFYSPMDDYYNLDGDEFLCKKDRIIQMTNPVVDFLYLDCKLISSEKGRTKIPYMLLSSQKGSELISIDVFRANKEKYFNYDCDNKPVNCPIISSDRYIKKEGE